jgi:hypothetical protein
VFGVDLLKIEEDRDRAEREMTQKILDFNYKVRGESRELEEGIKLELSGVREEIVKEKKLRTEADQTLLKGVG